MNIFLICHVYPPEFAPAGVNYRELAEDLTRAGHKVTMITGWPSHPVGVLFKGWRARWRSVERMPEGFRLMRCGHSLHARYRMIWKLWYYFTFAVSTFVNGLAAGPCDAVFSSSTPIFGSFTAWLLAWCKGAKHLYWMHDLIPESPRNAGMLKAGCVYRTLLALDTLVCRNSALIGVLTDSMTRHLIERGLEPGKIVLLLHWVDARKILPGPKDNPWSRRHEVPLDKFIVLSAGTIGWISGAEIIVEAARLLHERKDMFFLIVGDGPVKEPMMKKAAGYGLTNMMFQPFQPAKDLADVQAAGDVGLVTLLPATGESSIPSKMHGYTAAQRPVIASVAADCPTAVMVTQNEFGIVCASQDSRALADAIIQMADHPDQARQMAAKGREFFLRTYDREACTAQAEKYIVGLFRK